VFSFVFQACLVCCRYITEFMRRPSIAAVNVAVPEDVARIRSRAQRIGQQDAAMIREEQFDDTVRSFLEAVADPEIRIHTPAQSEAEVRASIEAVAQKAAVDAAELDQRLQSGKQAVLRAMRVRLQHL